MKRLKIVFSLLFIVMLLFIMTTDVFAIEDDNVVLSDMPFDYMTNMQTKSFEKYEDLSTSEQKLVYSIPEDVAKTLTTKALLETILNNDYIIDLFAYDDFVLAVKSREIQYRIIEFLKREDSLEVLNTYIEKYEEEVSKNYSADTNRQLRLMNKIKDNSYYILNDVERPQNKISTGVVYTKGGVGVNCYFNRGWENADGTTQEEESEDFKEYKNKYNIKDVSGISPLYNCHSYAWYSNSYITNNVCIEGEDELQKYITEAKQSTDTPQIGYTKVIYYYNITAGFKVGNISHSAKVYSVYSNGKVEKVISKWGNNGLFIHTINDCPYYYPIFNPDVGYFNY